MQTNDLQSNDMCAHILAPESYRTKTNISWSSRNLFQWNERCYSLKTLLQTQWNRSHNTKMSIYGRTISYGFAPLNKIEPKLQFLVMKNKNRKKVTRIETKFHEIHPSSLKILKFNTWKIKQPISHHCTYTK